MRLDGKVALITGGASGMGRVASALFAREGAKVVLTDVADEAGEATAAEIRDAGGEAAYVHAERDVPDPFVGRVDRPVLGQHHAGVVVQDVQAAEPVDGGVHHRLRVGLLRDVGVDVRGLAAGVADLRGGGLAGLVGDVGEDDPRALAREQAGRDPAHPARPAGDQRDLPVQTHRGSLPFGRGEG